MKLRKSVSSISVSLKAVVDAVVLIPIPGEVMDKIGVAVRDSTKVEVLEETLHRLYWKPEAVDENSLMAFVGEFKKRLGTHNRNQLLADLLTAQSQRRAFGLPDIIVWGAVCSAGQFQVFSSIWNDTHTVRLIRPQMASAKLTFSGKSFFAGRPMTHGI
jgi:hypothetical protein